MSEFYYTFHKTIHIHVPIHLCVCCERVRDMYMQKYMLTDYNDVKKFRRK